MRHFVQMGCCDQFQRWLAGYKICPAIAAQTGKAPIKNVNITEKTLKSGSRTKIFGNNHIKTGKSKTGKTGLG
jgi:hypothetical protein